MLKFVVYRDWHGERKVTSVLVTGRVPGTVCEYPCKNISKYTSTHYGTLMTQESG